TETPSDQKLHVARPDSERHPAFEAIEFVPLQRCIVRNREAYLALRRSTLRAARRQRPSPPCIAVWVARRELHEQALLVSADRELAVTVATRATNGRAGVRDRHIGRAGSRRGG